MNQLYKYEEEIRSFVQTEVIGMEFLRWLRKMRQDPFEVHY